MFCTYNLRNVWYEIADQRVGMWQTPDLCQWRDEQIWYLSPPLVSHWSTLWQGSLYGKIMDNDHFIYEAGFFKGMRRNGEVLVMQMTSHGRMVDMGQWCHSTPNSLVLLPHIQLGDGMQSIQCLLVQAYSINLPTASRLAATDYRFWLIVLCSSYTAEIWRYA